MTASLVIQAITFGQDKAEEYQMFVFESNLPAPTSNLSSLTSYYLRLTSNV